MSTSSASATFTLMVGLLIKHYQSWQDLIFFSKTFKFDLIYPIFYKSGQLTMVGAFNWLFDLNLVLVCFCVQSKFYFGEGDGVFVIDFSFSNQK